MMRRRFLATATAALLAAPRIVLAQQQLRLRQLAWVNPASPVERMKESGGNSRLVAIFAELRRLGWVENVTLQVDYWSGLGRADKDAWIHDIYASKPDLVLFPGYEAYVTQILREVGSVPTIVQGQDPVALGLVKSFPHPGGSITGFTVDAGLDLSGKLLQLIAEGVPGAKQIGRASCRERV